MRDRKLPKEQPLRRVNVCRVPVANSRSSGFGSELGPAAPSQLDRPTLVWANAVPVVGKAHSNGTAVEAELWSVHALALNCWHLPARSNHFADAVGQAQPKRAHPETG